MFDPRTTHVVVRLCLAVASASCAAEHLDARDAARGPGAPGATTAPIVRPTDLQATEKQITPTPATSASPAPSAPSVDTTPASPHAMHHGAHAKVPAAPTRQPIYSCPMHPEVRATKPGVCPKCGMTLKEQEPTP